MTSTRSYRRALSQETAFAELRDGAGTQFNAECVEAFIAAIERRDEHYGAGHEVDEHEWAVAPPEAGTGSAGLGHLVPEEQAAGREAMGPAGRPARRECAPVAAGIEIAAPGQPRGHRSRSSVAPSRPVS